MRTPLLVLGLGLSIPLIVFGSTVLLKVMQRYPAIITLGAAVLGFVAGEMAVTDLSINSWFEAHMHGLDWAVAVTCAIGVVLVGRYLAKRQPEPMASA
ncbi:TerC family protein, partial [Roseateles sp. GG27B]